MKKHLWKASIICGVALLAALAGWDKPAGANDEVAVVVNSMNPVASLSNTEIYRIFTGEKGTWSNGKHVLVIMAAPGTPERALILKSVYKMSENDYVKYFMQAAFTGAVSAPPREAASSAQVLQLVAENPWAIGYVKEQDVASSVKVVSKLP